MCGFLDIDIFKDFWASRFQNNDYTHGPMHETFRSTCCHYCLEDLTVRYKQHFLTDPVETGGSFWLIGFKLILKLNNTLIIKFQSATLFMK